MLLTSRCRVDSTSIKDQDVALVLLQYVFENVYSSSIKVHQAVVFIVKVVSLRQVASLVENSFSCLCYPLLSL